MLCSLSLGMVVAVIDQRHGGHGLAVAHQLWATPLSHYNRDETQPRPPAPVVFIPPKQGRTRGPPREAQPCPTRQSQAGGEAAGSRSRRGSVAKQ